MNRKSTPVSKIITKSKENQRMYRKSLKAPTKAPQNDPDWEPECKYSQWKSMVLGPTAHLQKNPLGSQNAQIFNGNQWFWEPTAHLRKSQNASIFHGNQWFGGRRHHQRTLPQDPAWEPECKHERPSLRTPAGSQNEKIFNKKQ